MSVFSGMRQCLTVIYSWPRSFTYHKYQICFSTQLGKTSLRCGLFPVCAANRRPGRFGGVRGWQEGSKFPCTEV